MRREILSAVRVAVVREEVASLIPAADIQLPVRPEHHPSAAVVGAVRQAGEKVDGTRQSLRQWLIRVAANLHSQIHATSRVAVIRVRDVDVVGSLALEQIRVQRHSEQAILREGLIHLVNGDRDCFRSVGWIDAGDPLADALGDPQESIGTPRDLPRALEAGRHDSRDERLWSLGRDDARVLCGNRTLRAKREHRRARQRDHDGRYARHAPLRDRLTNVSHVWRLCPIWPTRAPSALYSNLQGD